MKFQKIWGRGAAVKTFLVFFFFFDWGKLNPKKLHFVFSITQKISEIGDPILNEEFFVLTETQKYGKKMTLPPFFFPINRVRIVPVCIRCG